MTGVNVERKDIKEINDNICSTVGDKKIDQMDYQEIKEKYDILKEAEDEKGSLLYSTGDMSEKHSSSVIPFKFLTSPLYKEALYRVFVAVLLTSLTILVSVLSGINFLFFLSIIVFISVMIVSSVTESRKFESLNNMSYWVSDEGLVGSLISFSNSFGFYGPAGYLFVEEVLDKLEEELDQEDLVLSSYEIDKRIVEAHNYLCSIMSRRFENKTLREVKQERNNVKDITGLQEILQEDDNISFSSFELDDPENWEEYIPRSLHESFEEDDKVLSNYPYTVMYASDILSVYDEVLEKGKSAVTDEDDSEGEN